MPLHPPPTKEELEQHRADGKTREQLATIYGVPLSQIKRWISSLKVSKKLVRREAYPSVPKQVRSRIHDDEGLTIMERAKRILGARLREQRGVGYVLDGKVANTDAILKAAHVSYKRRH
jgi:hypothetical protein